MKCRHISRSHATQPGIDHLARLLNPSRYSDPDDEGGRQLLAFFLTSLEQIEKEGYMHTPPSPPVQATTARFSVILTRLLQSLSGTALFSLEFSLKLIYEEVGANVG